MERSLYAYLYVDQPFEEVVEVLTRRPATILQQATDSSRERAEQFHGRLRVGLGAFELGREIVIEVGHPVPLGAHAVSLPIRWEAADHAALFPSMRGALEASALSNRPPCTQLTFIGHYRPPLGIVGGAADASVGHRLAEAAVHHFLADAVVSIEAELDRRHAAVSLVD